MDLSSVITEINSIMSRLRTSTTQRDMKDFAYYISLFSWFVWDLFRVKEASELKYKIALDKETSSNTKAGIAYNKAEKEAKIKLHWLLIKATEANTEYKKALLLKESYVNFMWICKQEQWDWQTTDTLTNVFSNISD